ncbi:MAG: acetyl-CoA carboxylase biotin carboxyl carrier protein [Treponema sp.]|jgi:acetyl-CoA carboxylase biotin carboxyl carrier protein|nr:acetyl-CoA carboxylase biotin carboxyl carrier protein [Treponema sp.]
MNDKLLLTLLDKFSASAAAELDLDDGATRLILRKEAAFAAGGAKAGGRVLPEAGASVPEGAAAGAEGSVHLGLPAVPAADQAGNETVTSPIVATFYSAPGSDAPPFVKSGSRVKAGDSLCILEAMKMMNHLEAEFDCEILSVKASNGDLVEYGQPLFEVRRL